MFAQYSDYIAAIVLGIVEGLTEFLPISSTGHMILVGKIIGFEGARASTFEIVIQLGAILAVVWLYFDRFVGLLPVNAPSEGFRGWRGIFLLMLACLPAFVLGPLCHSYIKAHLFGPLTVALALIVGAVLMLVAEAKHRPSGVDSLDKISTRLAFLLGIFQCFALWPGFSRSGSMMIGGLFLGMHRKISAEFSFLVAVPIMAAAAIYDLYKSYELLQASDIPLFIVGSVVSFLTAVVAIKVFLLLLTKVTLRPFAYYRLLVGLLVLYLLVGN